MTQAIIIAGAGIGGLTTALGLQRAGIKVRVLEQADKLGEIGAGVSLAPNATRALNSLGILPEIRARGHIPDRAAIKHYRSGEQLSGFAIGAQMESEWGSPYVQIHRADLHAILVESVRANDADAIVLGARVESFSQNEQAVTVNTTAGNFVGACLIGADGIRSAVRSAMVDEAAPTFLGYVAWRGVVPIDMLSMPTNPDTAVFIGPKKSLLRYKVRNGKAVNIVAFAQSDGWSDEDWSQAADPVELRACYADWADEIQDLIACLCEVGAHKWGLFGRTPLPGWQQGRITLVGDAAHPMLPFLGQGAAMAIEDGVLLARALGEMESADRSAIQNALRRYENVRYERTLVTIKRANAQGLKIHSYPVDELTTMPIPQDDFFEYAFDASTIEMAQ